MKKLLLFISLESILIALLVSVLSLYNKSLNAENSGRRVIKIVRGDSKNDKLQLDPAGDPISVFKGKEVTWEIAPSSNVKSFRIEMKKRKSSQIFLPLLRPSAKLKTKANGTVKILIGDDKVYNYNILWKMNDDKDDRPERKFDPKLAINPNIHLAPLEKLIYAGFAILALLTFSVFFINKKERI